MAIRGETTTQYNARKKEYTESLKLFKWQWEDVLAHATAETTKFWDEDKRYFCKIHNGGMEADNPSPRSAPWITPADEAFAYLAIENAHNRWQNEIQLSLKHPGKTFTYAATSEKAKNPFTAPTSDPNGTVNGFVPKGDKELILFGPKWKAKYSIMNAGSDPTGGWSTAGKERYLVIWNAVKFARTKATTNEMEEEVLDALRTDKGYQHKSYELEKRNKRQKTTTLVSEGVLLAADAFDMSAAASDPGEIAEV